jgi:hypothetical protein
MRDLIRKVLREFHQPILVYEIKLGNKLLNERDEFVRVLHRNGDDILLYKNTHSLTGVDTKSNYARVSIEEINESIRNVESEFIEFIKERVLDCGSKSCGINFIDFGGGFDYQCWLDKRPNGNIRVIINTSIYHPKKLFNSDNSPTMVISQSGSISYRYF